MAHIKSAEHRLGHLRDVPLIDLSIVMMAIRSFWHSARQYLGPGGWLAQGRPEVSPEWEEMSAAQAHLSTTR
jgi:hypothetical protein